jgi:V/A-type H+/Na+-transporting ATPase subunit C
MFGYDYGNARLRVMKSRLLTSRELDALVEAGSIQGLITALTKTAYRKSVEAALARTGGMDCIAEALRTDLITSLGKLNTFYRGQAKEMVGIALRCYDVYNLKAILRGLSRHASPGEILATLLPVGELPFETLAELASASRARLAIDLLASVVSPFAQPLLSLRIEHPGIDVSGMELALDQWHYQKALKYLSDEFLTDSFLFFATNLDADLTNLLTVLRFAQAPAERKGLRERLDIARFEDLLLGPGRLPSELLVQAADQDSVESAVETLTGTAYEGPLREGLQAYARTSRLSEFEKKLRRYRLDWASRLIIKDPLGIGVVLGYLALKINEIGNIRWIAQGINLGLKPSAIRSEVEFVG